MKIIDQSQATQFSFLSKQGPDAHECTKQLLDLIRQADRGQAIHVTAEEWTRKSLPTNVIIQEKTGKTVSIRTLEDRAGWVIFIL